MATTAQRDANVEALGVDVGAEATFPRGAAFAGTPDARPIRLASNLRTVGDLWQEYFNGISGDLPVRCMTPTMLVPFGTCTRNARRSTTS